MRQEIRFATARDGVRLAYAISGSGAPLVKAPTWLSHVGMDADSPVWRHWWEEFAAEHQFIRFDQRGCGLSDRVASDISFDAWVGDLESVVDAMGARRFVLVGMSQGGPIAVEYARRHPERVSHLVVVGGYVQGWRRRGTPLDEHVALLTLIREGWGNDNPAFRQIFTSQFMPEATPEQSAWFNELERMSSSAESAARFQEAVGDIDVEESARHVEVPTAVFHSRDDARVPFDQGRRLAGLIPGARFITLQSKNHILMENEPAWSVFKTEFRDFISQERAARADPRGFSMGRLSAREREVLALVSTGLTDREIAAALSLSTRTVGNHVQNILTKMDAPNRAAAVALAVKLDLL